MLTDVLRELVRESRTTVQQYLLRVAALAPAALLTSREVPSAAGWMIELAVNLAALWNETQEDDSWIRRLQRCTLPRSALLLSVEPASRDAAATRACQFIHRINEGSQIVVADLADERTLSGIEVLLPVLAENRTTLIVHNLQRVLESQTEVVAKHLLKELCNLVGGVVATVPSYADVAQLSRYFDVALSATAIDDFMNRDSGSEDRLKSFAEALRREPPERPVGKELARVPLSLRRELVVEQAPSSLLPSTPFVLRISCSAYRERDDAGRRIPISSGAVEQILGGALTDTDYRQMAEKFLDPAIVGRDFATAAAQYVSRLRDDPQHRRQAFLELNKRLELHPLTELVFLALELVATEHLRQPFETI